MSRQKLSRPIFFPKSFFVKSQSRTFSEMAMAEEMSEGGRVDLEGVGGASGAASGTLTATSGLGASGGAIGGGAPPLQADPVDGENAVEAFPECVAAGLADMGVHHAKFQENYGKVVMDAVLPMQRQLAAKVARKIGESVATAAGAVDAVSDVLLCVWYFVASAWRIVAF